MQQLHNWPLKLTPETQHLPPAELAQCSDHRWAFPKSPACLSAFLPSFRQFLQACFLVAVCVFAQMSPVVIRPWSFVIGVVTLNAANFNTNWKDLIGLGVILAAIIIIDSSDSVGEERLRGDF